MRFFIILYLSIVFIMTVSSQTPYLPGGGVSIQNETSQFETTTKTEIGEQIKNDTSGALGFLDLVKGSTSAFVKTVVKMSSFNYTVQGAPKIVNDFLSGFFGLLSVLFMFSILREVMRIVPFTG